jgi:hypothetical protein
MQTVDYKNLDFKSCASAYFATRPGASFSMSYPNLRSVPCKRPGSVLMSFDFVPFAPRGGVDYDTASPVEMVEIRFQSLPELGLTR